MRRKPAGSTASRSPTRQQAAPAGPYSFDSVEKPRLSSNVARQLKLAIHEGRFLPGDRLPPERALTEQFGVSRPILREALRLLEEEGLVATRHGKGTFVANVTLEDTDTLPLAEWLSDSLQLVYRYYEARLVLEPKCAALAAKCASAQQRARLRTLVGRSGEMAAQDDLTGFTRLDVEFHSTIAEASGNAFLVRMLASIIRPRDDLRGLLMRIPDHMSAACQGHERILQAIEARDADRARKAMIDALVFPLDAARSFLTQEEPSA